MSLLGRRARAEPRCSALRMLGPWGWLRRLGQEGVACPWDLPWSGYDDIEFASERRRPATSCASPITILGRAAAELPADEPTGPTSTSHRRFVFQARTWSLGPAAERPPALGPSSLRSRLHPSQPDQAAAGRGAAPLRPAAIIRTWLPLLPFRHPVVPVDSPSGTPAPTPFTRFQVVLSQPTMFHIVAVFFASSRG